VSEFGLSHNKVSLVEGRKRDARDARMVRKALLDGAKFCVKNRTQNEKKTPPLEEEG
jgi:hypothetical protein